MATVEELLASSGDSAKLTVNLTSRKIVVPTGIKNIGVESDDDVMCLPFSIPRYFGDVDLSEFDIRINYRNAKGEGDVYLVNEFVTTDEDTIEFEWIVGRYAVAYEGEVIFNLCLKKMDENSIVVKEFNTTTCSLPVLKGLETDEAIMQENPDLINQMIDQASKEASGYLEDVVNANMNQALEEIIALQESFINEPEMITFDLNGTNYTCPKGMTWAELETYDGGAIWTTEGLSVQGACIYTDSMQLTTWNMNIPASLATYPSDIIRDYSDNYNYST